MPYPLRRSAGKNDSRHRNKSIGSSAQEPLLQRHSQSRESSRVSQDTGLQSQLGAVNTRTSSEKTLVDQHAPRLFLSRDGKTVIPQPVVDTIAQKLKEKALRDYADLRAFSIEHDVEFESLENIIGAYAGKDWPRVVIDVDQHSFLCSDVYAESIKVRIRESLDGKGHGSELIDLTFVVGHTVPVPIIVALATEVTNGHDGQVHVAGDHVIWSHKCISCAEKKQTEQARTDETAEYVRRLEKHGFCVLPQFGGLDQMVAADYTRLDPNRHRPQSIPLIAEKERPGTPVRDGKLLVDPVVLHEELEVMKFAIAKRTEMMWRNNPASAIPRNIVRLLQPSDFTTVYRFELATLLVRSDYIGDLEAVAEELIAELYGDGRKQCIHLIEERLWCPLHLYAAGVLETHDSILKQDLEDFAMERFCQQVIPQTIARARELSLLNESHRAAAMDRLQKASMQVRTFDDLQVAIAEAGENLFIDSPSEDLIFQTKDRHLEHIVSEMSYMTRSLDIMQNLLWVLLATSGPGLFVSSVKYTSRMITQYDEIGDPQITGLMRLWWEKAQVGACDDEDVRQMKELARDAVEVWKRDE